MFLALSRGLRRSSYLIIARRWKTWPGAGKQRLPTQALQLAGCMTQNKLPRISGPLLSHLQHERQCVRGTLSTELAPQPQGLAWVSLTRLDIAVWHRAAFKPAVPLVAGQLLLPAHRVLRPGNSIQVKDARVGSRAGAQLRGQGLPTALLQVRGWGPALFALVPARRRRRKDTGQVFCHPREEATLPL